MCKECVENLGQPVVEQATTPAFLLPRNFDLRKIHLILAEVDEQMALDTAEQGKRISRLDLDPETVYGTDSSAITVV